MFDDIKYFDPKTSKICSHSGKDYYCIISHLNPNKELVKIYFEKFNNNKISVKCSKATKIILDDFYSRINHLDFNAKLEEEIKERINKRKNKYFLRYIFQNRVARRGLTQNASFRLYFNWGSDER